MSTKTPYNPFLIAGYHSPAYFCDRETETNKIISALTNDRNISLLSPRRYGKTGLIKHVFHTINQTDPSIVCIYLDLFPSQNLNDFVKLLAESALRKADGKLDTAIQKFASFFKSFRPTITFDSLSGQPEISVKIETETNHQSLGEIFSYLQASGKRCYIAIDEFQQITEYPEKGTEALLRSHIQFLPNIKFIFAGSRQHLMHEIFLSAKRPFYQSTQLMTLDVVSRDMYFLFAAEHFNKANITLSKTSFDTLYTLFEGHTWYMQAMLNRLYEYRRNIDDDTILFEALYELIEENSYSYQELLNAYSTVQANLLKAVAKEKIVAQINAGNFISKYGLKNVSSITRALNKMLENELIYKSEKGYIIYDRFFGIWLSKL